jgi:serine/threonine-protein kinase
MDAEARSGDGERADEHDAHRLGRFRIIAELGRGATSVVHLGVADAPGGFHKPFALKRLRPALAQHPDLVDLFVGEARVGSQLVHPNIVTTLEIDEAESIPYIVMEYLDGQTLQNLVVMAKAAFMPLPLHAHLGALSGALEGLAYAHTATGGDDAPLHVVHRDVGPHNIFVTSNGVAKVLDFGCAQTGAHLTPSPMINSEGRVRYMSPEQAKGRVVDARSDLFAMGVMVWEAVTRKRLWPEEARTADIMRALVAGELPAARVTELGRASEPLRAIALKATAAELDERYASAAVFQADLQSALRDITPADFAPRDLGKRLVTVFAAERARLRATIERARERSPGLGRISLTPPPPSVRPADGQATPPSGPVSPRRASVPPPASARTAPPSPTPAQPVAPFVPRTPPSMPLPGGSVILPAVPRTSPLPSFPLPAEERRANGARVASIVAVAAVAVLAAVLAARALVGGAPSVASSAATPATAIATGATAEAPAPPPQLTAATQVPATAQATAAETAAAPPPEAKPVAVPREPAAPLPRAAPRPAARPVVTVEPAPPPPPAATPAAATPAPAGARPAHPIDALNPYAP